MDHSRSTTIHNIVVGIAVVVVAGSSSSIVRGQEGDGDIVVVRIIITLRPCLTDYIP